MKPSPAARWRRGGRRLRSRRAATDIPLELLIIVIILAIVVPILLAALVTYTRDQQIIGMQEQASNIADIVVQTYDGGINTTLLLSVDLPADSSITVGGPLYCPDTGAPSAHGPCPTGVPFNVFTSWINMTFAGSSPSSLIINNGAGDVPASYASCASGSLVYQAFTVPGGSSELAFTKLTPGATFECGGTAYAVPHPYVEVETVP